MYITLHYNIINDKKHIHFGFKHWRHTLYTLEM